ncbi:hypothetical protein ETAA1_62100 [Urbifossiella limnaea]|uniref:Uncharacterized protein n=1 Tax=Urbifossiella limnaea TaxID=2528023 RepID=A0A517Y301_9BACT|nr:hypothetical protein ETAA1_62100 [Urbifossiella limnaea]
MIFSPTAALQQIRADIAAVLSPDVIRRLCQEAGHT